MKKGIILLVLCALLLPTWFVLAQDTATSTLEITGANASDLPTITITANVIDSSSRPIGGLTADDFILGGSLSDVATIISVENVTSDNLPFATVLVIDVSSSMSGLPLEQAKLAATQFVQSIGADDPVAIVTFGSSARLVLDYTTDKDLLLQTIANLGFGGRTALYDAAVLGIEVASEAPIPRRAVILLSDGAEFGGLSRSLRGAGIERAAARGVTVYTIGLGFGIDRSFLQELASGTNARNYESPSPDELGMIYGELADLFRSQYVITLDAPDLLLDGTEYDFTLQAGNSNEASSVIRAPIPVPIVRLPDDLFTEPIATLTTVTPVILADDELASTEILLRGVEIILDDNGSFTIDPLNFAPGTYTLAVRAIDVDGDSGADEGEFEIAALPSVVTFDTVFGEDPITETQIVTLTTSGQTSVESAFYGVVGDGVTDIAPATTDAENNFPYILDPAKYPAGVYTLRADVTNAGGVISSVTQPFTIGSIPPSAITITGIEAGATISEPVTIGISATTQAGTEIADIQATLADGTNISDDLTLNPGQLQVGETELTITVTDSNGATTTSTIPITIGALPPEITLAAVPAVVSEFVSTSIEIDSQAPVVAVNYDFDGGITIPLVATANGSYPPIPIDPAELGDGAHTLTITIENNAGLTATTSATFTVANPTPTATPSPTIDATANAVGTSDALAAAQATLDSESTTSAQVETAQADVNRQETVAANATNVADTFATREAGGTATGAALEAMNEQATSDAQATVESESLLIQATTDAQATADAQITADAEGTINAQSTADEQATVDAQATNDAVSTEDAVATAAEGTRVAAVEETEEPTVEPTEAATTAPTATVVEPTETFEATFTTAPTLTPIGDIVEVDAQDAPPASGPNLLLVIAGGLGILAVLFFILRRGRQNNT